MFVDEPHGFSGQLDGPIELSLARNERESTQIVLFPGRAVPGARVEVSDLTSDAGRVMDRVEVHVVGHVNLLSPRTDAGRAGWHPDPLLPNRAVDLEAGVPQSFLVSVGAGAATEPGTYTGTVSVTAPGTRLERELVVEVWNVTLPARPRFKSANLSDWRLPERMWPPDLGFPEPGDAQRLEDMLRLAEMGFAYRLPPTGFLANGLRSWNQGGRGNTTYGFPTHDPTGEGTGTFNAERTDRLLDFMLERGANHFFIGLTGNVWRPRGDSEGRRERLVTYLQEYRAHLAARGLLDLALVYGIDEPWGEEVADARRTFTLLREHVGGDLRVMQNTNQNNHRIIPDLAGFFDVLDLNLGFYDVTGAAKARDASPGAIPELWWNVNRWPDTRPNLFIEYPLVDARVIGPMSYAHAVHGFEYWSMLWTGGMENYHPVRADELRIRWNVGEQSLDGSLVYPAEDRRIHPSLRLVSFRDGLEDLELLYLLEESSPGHPLLDVPVVRGISDFDTDPRRYLEFRRAVARAVMEARSVSP